MFGDIKLPLQNAIKVDGDDMKILDYLFDMKAEHMSKFLKALAQNDVPALLVANVRPMNMVGLVVYRPIEAWLDFKDQRYQLFLAPNIQNLIDYWAVRKAGAEDDFENDLIQGIINYLAQFMRTTVSHT